MRGAQSETTQRHHFLPVILLKCEHLTIFRVKTCGGRHTCSLGMNAARYKHGEVDQCHPWMSQLVGRGHPYLLPKHIWITGGKDNSAEAQPGSRWLQWTSPAMAQIKIMQRGLDERTEHQVRALLPEMHSWSLTEKKPQTSANWHGRLAHNIPKCPVHEGRGEIEYLLQAEDWRDRISKGSAGSGLGPYRHRGPHGRNQRTWWHVVHLISGFLWLYSREVVSAPFSRNYKAGIEGLTLVAIKQFWKKSLYNLWKCQSFQNKNYLSHLKIVQVPFHVLPKTCGTLNANNWLKHLLRSVESCSRFRKDPMYQNTHQQCPGGANQNGSHSAAVRKKGGGS